MRWCSHAASRSFSLAAGTSERWFICNRGSSAQRCGDTGEQLTSLQLLYSDNKVTTENYFLLSSSSQKEKISIWRDTEQPTFHFWQHCCPQDDLTLQVLHLKVLNRTLFLCLAVTNVLSIFSFKILNNFCFIFMNFTESKTQIVRMIWVFGRRKRLERH